MQADPGKQECVEVLQMVVWEVSPSGREAGEYMHEAALTFVFLTQHVYTEL